ncbi:hypothetical protein CEXT_91981 [Caerostris extrusa]|uniref:Uncharacterized protein n=1 Tax=Caerostris extrusa TaxID=172846 RepID=A0AAV4ND69_CAEEX|nr:hypothetical protein CEXT_91981 [Caerostris extrusa]
MVVQILSVTMFKIIDEKRKYLRKLSPIRSSFLSKHGSSNVISICIQNHWLTRKRKRNGEGERPAHAPKDRLARTIPRENPWILSILGQPGCFILKGYQVIKY